VALRRSDATLERRAVPLAGLLAAFIFAAQMLNVPIAAGTSGHLLGAGLAAVLLGPWLATVSLTAVVLVQALLFADGGVVALGLNVLNMAVVAPWLAWGTLRLARAALPRNPASDATATFLAGAFGVVGAAAAFGLEYALGGVGGAPVLLVAGTMLGVHAVIGVGEGLITAAVVGTIRSIRSDLVAGAHLERPRAAPGARRRRLTSAAAVLAALALAAAAGPLASSLPDGLDHVASTLGFAGHERPSPVAAGPLAGYSMPGVAAAVAGTSLAGMLGVLAVLAVTAAVRGLVRGRHARGSEEHDPL
jgi:cobalt/nickel transport system permease protein